MTKSKFISVVLSLCMILSVFTISASAAPSLTFGGFNYKTIEISLSADVGDASVSEAMVYVYANNGTAPNDTNPPVYMDVVELTGGILADKTISLPLDFAYGDYVLAVYYEGTGSPLLKEFTYHSPENIVNARKQQILEEVKSAPDAAAIEEIFFSADSAGGVKIPANDVIINSSADFTVYESVEDKTEVFNRMIVKGFSDISDFDKMLELFAECAKEQKNAENREGSSSSQPSGSDNKKPGGNKGNMVVSGGGSSGGSGSSGSTGSSSNQGSAQQPEAPKSVFADMKGHWAEDYANKLSEKKIINGYEDGTFKGDNKVTRAELTKMLVTAFAISADAGAEFKDVDKNSWYYDFVVKASGAGVVNGFDGYFNPDSSVTRQDAALMIYRVMKNSGKLTDGTKTFADSNAIAEYAATAVASLGNAGILNGDTNGNFNPDSPITRAEIAACLCRAMDYSNAN